MITIAILDDEKIFLEKEKAITEKYFSQKVLECRIDTFQNADWLVMGLEEEQYDIYILDVELPKKSGLEVAREIRSHYPDPVIIFVTNFIDYAVEAYEVNTYRYIPKEIMEEKLESAYDTLIPKILAREEKYYVVEKRTIMSKILYEDILYLKKDKRYTVLTYRGGEVRIRKSMADVFQELNSPEFLIIEKGCIVNIRHVMGLKGCMMRMRDGTLLSVGEPRACEVRKVISRYWRS